MKIKAIYDNGGKTADRYTVYYDSIEKRVIQHGSGLCKTNPKQRYINMYLCFGMSENPFHPQGFGQHSSGQLGKHNGKRIKFEDLPVDCQKAVNLDIN